MPYVSEPGLSVLLGLRLKGFAEAHDLVSVTASPLVEVVRHLEGFAADELVRYRRGRVSGWSLTASGRAEGESRLAVELDHSGAGEVVREAYARFLTGNGSMLALCTEWQMRDVDGQQVLNDHLDPGYDAAVVERLAQAHTSVLPVVDELAKALGRFEGYDLRLQNALDFVREGRLDWFTKPTLDSYHTIWFELHENLLATLGIERGSEPVVEPGIEREI